MDEAGGQPSNKVTGGSGDVDIQLKLSDSPTSLNSGAPSDNEPHTAAVCPHRSSHLSRTTSHPIYERIVDKPSSSVGKRSTKSCIPMPL